MRVLRDRACVPCRRGPLAVWKPDRQVQTITPESRVPGTQNRSPFFFSSSLVPFPLAATHAHHVRLPPLQGQQVVRCARVCLEGGERVRASEPHAFGSSLSRGDEVCVCVCFASRTHAPRACQASPGTRAQAHRACTREEKRGQAWPVRRAHTGRRHNTPRLDPPSTLPSLSLAWGTPRPPAAPGPPLTPPLTISSRTHERTARPSATWPSPASACCATSARSA